MGFYISHRSKSGESKTYVRRTCMRLCMAQSTQAATVRSMCAQAVVDLAQADLESLKFDRACFRAADAPPELVALVLRDVALPAPEIAVCSAVSLWGHEYYVDVDDDRGGGAALQACTAAPTVPAACRSGLMFRSMTTYDLPRARLGLS